VGAFDGKICSMHMFAEEIVIGIDDNKRDS